MAPVIFTADDFGDLASYFAALALADENAAARTEGPLQRRDAEACGRTWAAAAALVDGAVAGARCRISPAEEADTIEEFA